MSAPTRRPRATLIGEDNPHSADPRHALFPYPANCAGERLQNLVMGVGVADYLRDYERVNLCAGRWSAPEARDRAEELLDSERSVLVLLGAKVARAFGWPHEPFATYWVSRDHLDRPACRVVLLPHPSGRCRIWNSPDAFARAQSILRDAGVLA